MFIKKDNCMLSYAKKIMWNILKFLHLQNLLWDYQYKTGRWGKVPRSPITVSSVSSLCRGGGILEFGFGDGTLALLVPRSNYSYYKGYDISQVAVNAAKKRAQGQFGIEYNQGDMVNWQGESKKASIIVAEECLYYLKISEIENFLSKCWESLESDGCIFSVFHSKTKHIATITEIKNYASVVNEKIEGERLYLTLKRPV